MPRRPVRAERELVAAGRARHAQARVAVDVVGPQKPLGEFVADVLRFRRELTGNIQGHGVRAVLGDDPAQPIGDRPERHVERHALEGAAAAGRVPAVEPAALRVGEPVGSVDRLVDGAALRTQTAGVGGMILVAADAHHPPLGHVQHHPATDAAIRADGPDLIGGLGAARRSQGRLRSGRANPFPALRRPTVPEAT